MQQDLCDGCGEVMVGHNYAVGPYYAKLGSLKVIVNVKVMDSRSTGHVCKKCMIKAIIEGASETANGNGVEKNIQIPADQLVNSPTEDA